MCGIHTTIGYALSVTLYGLQLARGSLSQPMKLSPDLPVGCLLNMMSIGRTNFEAANSVVGKSRLPYTQPGCSGLPVVNM